MEWQKKEWSSGEEQNDRKMMEGKIKEMKDKDGEIMDERWKKERENERWKREWNGGINESDDRIIEIGEE